MKKINRIEEIDKKYINELLDELAISRPIFHNEQDFQFELAQKIKENINNKDIRIRLEYFIGESEGNRIYVDIMIIEKDKAIAIELKYKTKESLGLCNNERYNLKDQGADDFGCYYIYKDLERIERLVYQKNKEQYDNLNNIAVKKGYVIFLTNDGKTYKKKRKGIFKNYSLINEENIKKVTIKKGIISYCHKESPYEEYNYQDILNKYLNEDGKTTNYSSVNGKKPIEFHKKHEGEWSSYSNLEKVDNCNMQDVVDKLIFEVKKD